MISMGCARVAKEEAYYSTCHGVGGGLREVVEGRRAFIEASAAIAGYFKRLCETRLPWPEAGLSSSEW